jgi:hypothetical protein
VRRGERFGTDPPPPVPHPRLQPKKSRKVPGKSGSLRQRGAAGSRTQDGGFAIRCLSLLATAPFRPNPTAGRKLGSSVWDATREAAEIGKSGILQRQIGLPTGSTESIIPKILPRLFGREGCRFAAGGIAAPARLGSGVPPQKIDPARSRRQLIGHGQKKCSRYHRK